MLSNLHAFKQLTTTDTIESKFLDQSDYYLGLALEQHATREVKLESVYRKFENIKFKRGLNILLKNLSILRNPPSVTLVCRNTFT